MPRNSSEATLEYRQKIESDLLAKINATLDPLIGSEKFRAGVSVECDFTSGDQSEESIDPSKSVMLNSQKSDETSGTALNSGAPGVAANLPRPPVKAGAGSGGTSRRSESISYQTSRTVRHTRMPQGTIKRISVSVLVDSRFEVGRSALQAKACSDCAHARPTHHHPRSCFGSRRTGSEARRSAHCRHASLRSHHDTPSLRRLPRQPPLLAWIRAFLSGYNR